ncbi:disease resistance protein L6-like [Rhodamnia argentea]|uniref:Disease resistance protein L6-like n=1 Tax=Rhodamnia argentea TaxID=178133 RepID=A0A8B8NU81_9MYRT|nr:disease resistance protein L6-like [Rhodamnia argentea]
MHMPLIKIIDHDKIWIHNQLRDLGRDIVHQENRQRPGRCSRLWSPEVTLNVILENEGTDDVEALNLEAPNQMWSFTSEEIARLVKLRFLKLYGGKLVGDFENTFSKLRWLSWYHRPAKFQVTNLKLRNLVVLKLSGMYITECWRGWDHIKEAKNLKVLNITGCEYLTRVPNLSTFSMLERLILEDCERLVEIDSSIGELKCLVYLEINGCNSMEKLPAGSSLDKLGLARLYRELSVSTGELNSLIELPESIRA